MEAYLAICKANELTETANALQLNGYLNDIGVFLHFQAVVALAEKVRGLLG